MKRLALYLVSLFLVVMATGCAHPISLAPNVSAALEQVKVEKIPKKIGYYISPEDRTREVITPGGGGDKVSYLPYRDLETGLYVVLGQSFSEVSRIETLGSPKAAEQQLIIKPTITTTSYSDSLVTWPPTVFTVQLTLAVEDSSGKPVTQISAQGEGRAEFAEFKGDFSLAARRATENMLVKLKAAIAAAADKLR
ncbi:hypothetical protein [Pelomonas sp. BJYL3]|uniref:hypothetical protein n=1 Tax=Pelomonas sp. BJYL3 TaxID=2976697 RepID=UPI0022B3825C|nr:hypothetical protein [Pelomonas sp. BJYL3]